MLLFISTLQRKLCYIRFKIALYPSWKKFGCAYELLKRVKQGFARRSMFRSCWVGRSIYLAAKGEDGRAYGERKQVKVRKENSNEPGRVAFWWLRQSSPRYDEVWKRLRNSNVDMESAGARMLWITRSISCENSENFMDWSVRGEKKVSLFDSPVRHISAFAGNVTTAIAARLIRWIHDGLRKRNDLSLDKCYIRGHAVWFDYICVFVCVLIET